MPVTEKLRELRLRAGISKRKLAAMLGYRGPSSYLRYEDPALYRKQTLPIDLVQRLAGVLTGLGQPAITRHEVLQLAGLEGLTPQPVQQEITAALEALSRACSQCDLETAAAYCSILSGYIALARQAKN